MLSCKYITLNKCLFSYKWEKKIGEYDMYLHVDIECCLRFSIEDKLITSIIYAIISHLHCLRNCFTFGIYMYD